VGSEYDKGFQDGYKKAIGKAEGLVDGLRKIESHEWESVKDNSGPIDCTQNEKGLLRYVAQVNSFIKEALAKWEKNK